MKLGIYSITYRGVFYRGEALDVFSLMRLAARQGWEGVEFNTERPHAAPMDLSGDDRKRLRDLSGELGVAIAAISPNCDLSSPVPSNRESALCYARESIKLAHDVGSPICKVFAAWRGVTLHDGLASYALTYSCDPYPFWKEDRRPFVVASLRELAKMAEDYGIVLALQNHGPDVVHDYQDVLSLIREVGSPAFKACLDINIEPQADSPEYARKMVEAAGPLLVHSHINGEFQRSPDGSVVLVAGGYFDKGFWGRKVAYPTYVEALVASGFHGFWNWEFCHPALEDGKPAGIDYIHRQTALALEYMRKLRADAESKCRPARQKAG